ncbi:MAG: hypothetical protein WBA10_14205 [Elainellaceae cyanobacterium]
MVNLQQSETYYLEDGRPITWQIQAECDSFHVNRCTGAVVEVSFFSSIPAPLRPKFLDLLSVYAPAQIALFQGTGHHLDTERHQIYIGQSEPIYDLPRLFKDLSEQESGWYMVGDRVLVSPENSEISSASIMFELDNYYLGFPTEVAALPSGETLAPEAARYKPRWWPVAAAFILGAIAGLLGYVIGVLA